jgi:saccharopine dehydrogenase-like NADP-dependent oxidoreductase
MDLIHHGIWKPEGVVGPEWFDAKPFLDLLPSYGTEWKVRDEDTTGIVA